MRAAVLQTHGIEAHAVADLRGARLLWNQCLQLDIPGRARHIPGEALEFYEQIKEASARERFAFRVPVKATDEKSQQWGETVRFLAAA